MIAAFDLLMTISSGQVRHISKAPLFDLKKGPSVVCMIHGQEYNWNVLYFDLQRL
jgi:hypothetical protein